MLRCDHRLWRAWRPNCSALPWIELVPHPLYLPSKGLPPLGKRAGPGRRSAAGAPRDAVMRALTARSIRPGTGTGPPRGPSIGLTGRDPGRCGGLIATLPALEGALPGLAGRGRRRRAAALRAHRGGARRPRRGRARWWWWRRRRRRTGTTGLAELALTALGPGRGLPDGLRVAVSRLAGAQVAGAGLGGRRPGAPGRTAGPRPMCWCAAEATASWPKHCAHGVPMVTVPGGGDQWEIANRVVRQGSGRLIRPLTAEALTAAVGAVLARSAVSGRRRAGPGRRGRGGRSGTGVPRRGGGDSVGCRRAHHRVQRTRHRPVRRRLRGASVLVDHVLSALGGRTAAQAIEAGVEPRDRVAGVVRDFDVPRDGVVSG